MMIKNCKTCSIEFHSDLNLNPYCSSLCRSRDKFLEIEGIDKKFKVWKKNYEKYPEFYISIKSYKDRYKNKCLICGSEYVNFSMCCSKKCSDLAKKESTMKTTGRFHNLESGSISRKNMQESLKEKYGISNVFQRSDVKEKLKNTWSLKYGYSNPSKVDYIKNKKRETAEKNGFIIPLYLKDLRSVYEENVHSITWSQMKRFGRLKFGYDVWHKIKESRKLPQNEWLTVDHKYSRNDGFINGISCEIIGHICNLEILSFTDNRNKWSKSSISMDHLLNEIEKFEKTLKF